MIYQSIHRTITYSIIVFQIWFIINAHIFYWKPAKKSSKQCKVILLFALSFKQLLVLVFLGAEFLYNSLCLELLAKKAVISQHPIPPLVGGSPHACYLWENDKFKWFIYLKKININLYLFKHINIFWLLIMNLIYLYCLIFFFFL